VKERLRRWAGRAQRYSVQLVNIFGNIASIVALGLMWLASTAHDAILSVYLVVLTFALAVALIVRELQDARRVAYAEVLAPLHHAVHYIRDTLRTVRGLPERQFAHDHVQRVVDDVAMAFALATRTNCRVCIKVLSASPAAPDLTTLPMPDRVRYLLVRTYIRDCVNAPAHEGERADWLNDNSDLCELFTNPQQRRFISNDLQALYNRGAYRNSHLPGEFTQWPLPYRSAMVWPIRRLGGASVLHPDHELLGFLCVDAQMTNVFVERFDFEMGALFADALYSYMKANAGDSE
jgi:hypothetical protein